VRKALCAAVALIGAAALLAGCGGAGHSPGGVASLGSHTSSTSTTGSSAGAASASNGAEASPGSQAIAYSACMRAHGVPNFPDPQISHNGSEVRVKLAAPAGALQGDPKFKSAMHACSKLLPNGGAPVNQPTVSPQEQGQYLKAAACIRAHGIPSFPDPTFSGGGVHIDHQGLNESSPRFKAAVQACEALIPAAARGPR
jgi:hypothetical protein